MLVRLILILLFSINLPLKGQEGPVQNSTNQLLPSDLATLTGSWKGELTYLDYNSGKPYTMPVNLMVDPAQKPGLHTLHFEYPNEPRANSKERLKLSSKGKKMNGKSLHSREVLEDGTIRAILQYEGKDDFQKAAIKETYLMGKERLIIRKEVRFENAEEWILRNEYLFRRAS